MRKENTLTNAAEQTAGEQPTSAFEFLKSLPPNYDNPVLESYKKGRESRIVDYKIAEDFTDAFRTPQESGSPFFIPVAWTMTKAALVNLLGIKEHSGYEEVNGVRFYAGLNGDNQLTLVAVSTRAGNGCNDDLTVNDSYPYYDYAEPCPNDCSNRGNLKVQNGLASMLKVSRAAL